MKDRCTTVYIIGGSKIKPNLRQCMVHVTIEIESSSLFLETLGGATNFRMGLWGQEEGVPLIVYDESVP